MRHAARFLSLLTFSFGLWILKSFTLLHLSLRLPRSAANLMWIIYRTEFMLRVWFSWADGAKMFIWVVTFFCKAMVVNFIDEFLKLALMIHLYSNLKNSHDDLFVYNFGDFQQIALHESLILISCVMVLHAYKMMFWDVFSFQNCLSSWKNLKNDDESHAFLWFSGKIFDSLISVNNLALIMPCSESDFNEAVDRRVWLDLSHYGNISFRYLLLLFFRDRMGQFFNLNNATIILHFQVTTFIISYRRRRRLPMWRH
jgi:hypothetical protein